MNRHDKALKRRYEAAQGMLTYTLKEIGSLYDIPDDFPYAEKAKALLSQAFNPIPLSIRKEN